MQTFNKGDLIYGRYNVKNMLDKYQTYTKVYSDGKEEFISAIDIEEYKIELFPYTIDNNIIDSIDVMEALNHSNSKTFKVEDFINLAKSYNLILLNQWYLRDLLINDASRVSIKYIEGICIKNKFIKTYLLPKDKRCIYLVNISEDGTVGSYLKLS